nr:uncharacterized protein si:ch73-52p7.1 [Nothobranchius furzeri]
MYFSLAAPLLCLLLCAPVADMCLAYVTHSSFIPYSCSQEPQPCSASSLTDCRCKNIQLSSLHWPLSRSTPVFQKKHLTVWFTSPSNVVRLLNNSEVRHLTLIYCGPPGEARRTASLPLKEHFAVQKLERLTLLNVPERPFHRCSDANRVKSTNTDLNSDFGFYFDSNRYNRDKDTNVDFAVDSVRDSLTASPVQDIHLGRELGAAFHEQARLGIIHSSVLDWGAVIKAYTVQTHIDGDGVLPFPDLHLAKLPETSVIYVSFVY